MRTTMCVDLTRTHFDARRCRAELPELPPCRPTVAIPTAASAAMSDPPVAGIHPTRRAATVETTHRSTA